MPHAPQKRIRLSDLLVQSDALMRRYPPSSLKPEEIMGPQSVIFTWNEVGDEEDDVFGKVDSFKVCVILRGVQLYADSIHDTS